MNILLVDDDALLRDMYATKFSEAGHTVNTAENGEIALERIANETFDVILMDMVMPGIAGGELLRKIRETGATTKCIVLSNQGEESDIEAAKKEQVEGYIIKADMIPSEVVKKVESIVTS